MCGVACYFGKNREEGIRFGANAKKLLVHRGPDDNGIFTSGSVTLAHTRLSILELSSFGHQPMVSSCGRFTIVYNGEIYNHLELRKKYLVGHHFLGHSDTETIVELFRLIGEKMLGEMVGMWAIIIWDSATDRIFLSRDRYGQKPLYMRRHNEAWMFGSEMSTLLKEGESPAYDPTSLIEYLALGNYGHLGAQTFFKDIHQFPEGSCAWLSTEDASVNSKKYWTLPCVAESDKIPFDQKVKTGLHDSIVEAVLSQTLSDVPVGITLSGGIDSSIIAGILASYYDKGINIFTAQSIDSKYDETKYVDAVVKKNNNNNFIIHRNDLNELSLREHLERYIKIQEEPFGDPSIIAHGSLMGMAAKAGVKVILNGQGADEIFFGYNNMAQAVLSHQLKTLQLGMFYTNLSEMKMGSRYLLRSIFETFLPNLERELRMKSRVKRRHIINRSLSGEANDGLIELQKYNNPYNVWSESVYGLHIPHLVHYDDRNGMAYSIEGRMPFLDHRIAEYVAGIKTNYFLKDGLRKYILREACKPYLPELVYNRKDKIGFYTPLTSALLREKDWAKSKLKNNFLFNSEYHLQLIGKLDSNSLTVPEALHIWRCLSATIWTEIYNVNIAKN